MLNKENKITLDVSGISAADTLKETLDMHNITNAEFAKRIGVNQSYVTAILNRNRFMNFETAARIEEVTGISAEFLLTEDFNYKIEQLKLEKDKFDTSKIKRFDWVKR